MCRAAAGKSSLLWGEPISLQEEGKGARGVAERVVSGQLGKSMASRLAASNATQSSSEVGALAGMQRPTAATPRAAGRAGRQASTQGRSRRSPTSSILGPGPPAEAAGSPPGMPSGGAPPWYSLVTMGLHRPYGCSTSQEVAGSIPSIVLAQFRLELTKLSCQCPVKPLTNAHLPVPVPWASAVPAPGRLVTVQ